MKKPNGYISALRYAGQIGGRNGRGEAKRRPYAMAAKAARARWDKARAKEGVR